ncbi:hypothetical protein ISN45_Aa03g037350 [Arabidopsis thaliana x Arabidopsis arenosa]|uniref:Uncharacterized protein n=1 Tax=Arabidopsis thaliana x Arabidopsis arenosa TaxID=1240361 RepID=A0A8T2AZQ8_9BRAS|nr:hypothetical protein ISN45_Aa03g037350 [Arabidopsis thaliana x Arabidopsis arenosa]
MANRDFKIHALCLLTMLLQNLRPSISNLSPILTWVSFYNIQISSPCVGDVVSGIDGVSDRVHCDQVTLQSRASFLSFRESVSPTLSWPQLKCYGVGFFPASNGVHRFFTGTSLFHNNRIWVSHMNPSNSGIGNQFRTWDPGVIDCDSTVCVMKQRMHQFDHNWIQLLKSIIDKVKFWQHDLINIGWIRWFWNASARHTVEYMHKMHMGNCVNGRIRHDSMSIRRHKSGFINKTLFVEIHGERVTRRKTAAGARLNFTRLHERFQNPPAHRFNCLNDDDVDCVVGSNASLVVSSTEVTVNMLLCQGLCFFRVRVRDFLESENYKVEFFKKDFGTEALVPPCLHFRVIYGHIGFKATVCKKKVQPQVAACQS